MTWFYICRPINYINYINRDGIDVSVSEDEDEDDWNTSSSSGGGPYALDMANVHYHTFLLGLNDDRLYREELQDDDDDFSYSDTTYHSSSSCNSSLINDTTSIYI